jgi:hypothetical protein
MHEGELTWWNAGDRLTTMNIPCIRIGLLVLFFKL